MNIYSVDIKLCATAYIKADSEEQARDIAKEQFAGGNWGEIPTGWGDISVCGRSYDDPELPEVSLSPAVTFYGPWDNAWEFETVAEDVPTDEDEDDPDYDEDGNLRAGTDHEP